MVWGWSDPELEDPDVATKAIRSKSTGSDPPVESPGSSLGNELSCGVWRLSFGSEAWEECVERVK